MKLYGRSTLFWVVTQRVILKPYQPLKMGPRRCPEKSVRLYHYKLRNNPEERRSRLQYIAAEA